MNDEFPIEPRDEKPVEPDDEILIEIGQVSELTLGDVGIPIEGYIVNRRNL